MRISSILTSIGYLIICWISLFVTPKFKAIFMDLEVSLPILTQNIITFTGMLSLLSLTIAILIIVKDFISSTKKIPNWPFAILFFAIFFMIIIGLFLPIMTTMEGIE